MRGEYIVINKEFSDMMCGKVSLLDNTIIYNDAVTKEGVYVSVDWQYGYFKSDFDQHFPILEKRTIDATDF